MGQDFAKALDDLINWEGKEKDSYSYFKRLFVKGFGYKEQEVKIDTVGSEGAPDLRLLSREPMEEWLVCEVKPDKIFHTVVIRKIFLSQILL